MTTNFFEEISKLMVNFSMNLSITKKDDVLSVIFQMDPLGKSSDKTIPSVNMSGTAVELNEEFFTLIKEPVSIVNGLTHNVEEFKKEIEDNEEKSSSSGKKPAPKVKGKKVITAAEIIEKAKGYFDLGKWKLALAQYEKALGLSKDKKQKEQIKESISTCRVKIKAIKDLKGEEEDSVEEEEELATTDDNQEDETGEEEDSDEDSEEESEEAELGLDESVEEENSTTTFVSALLSESPVVEKYSFSK